MLLHLHRCFTIVTDFSKFPFAVESQKKKKKHFTKMFTLKKIWQVCVDF